MLDNSKATLHGRRLDNNKTLAVGDLIINFNGQTLQNTSVGDTQVVYSDGGDLVGSSRFTFDSGKGSFQCGRFMSLPTGNASVVVGQECQSTGSAYCFSGGWRSTATNTNTFSYGAQNVCGGEDCAIVGGFGNTITSAGRFNLATGSSNTISGERNFICGTSNTISGDYNLASGQSNSVSGDYNLCGGIENDCAGGRTLVGGRENTIATGTNNSIIAGYRCDILAGSGGSIVCGNECETSGENSLCVGNFCSVTGDHAVALGRGASASDDECQALGRIDVGSGVAQVGISAVSGANTRPTASGAETITLFARNGGNYDDAVKVLAGDSASSKSVSVKEHGSALTWSYTPTTPGDWSSAPDNIGDALDTLASDIPTIPSGGVSSGTYTPDPGFTFSPGTGRWFIGRWQRIGNFVSVQVSIVHPLASGSPLWSDMAITLPINRTSGVFSSFGQELLGQGSVRTSAYQAVATARGSFLTNNTFRVLWNHSGSPTSIDLNVSFMYEL
jgi:hypothetical protein